MNNGLPLTMADFLRVLITGGSGFIGTNAVEYFIARHQVLNLDIVAPINPAHEYYWRKVDLLDANTLLATVSDFNPHIVIHLAARTDLDGRTVDDYPANTIGVSNLLKALVAARSLQRVIFASSMLVCRIGYEPNSDLDFCPANPYGESKVRGELMVRELPPSVPWALVRPTSIWGPWFREPYRNFFDYVLKGRYFHIGDTRVFKTYGYVGNAIYQIQSILDAPASDIDGRVFYLGDSSQYDIREWADAIAHRNGLSIPQVPLALVRGGAWFGDLLKAFGLRFPMTSFRLKNMTTENRIDLRPTINLAPNPPFDRDRSIDLTIDWLRQHP
jgi:nucleoside-diphosphate-sugar epimerase